MAPQSDYGPVHRRMQSSCVPLFATPRRNRLVSVGWRQEHAAVAAIPRLQPVIFIYASNSGAETNTWKHGIQNE
jgi:hypothetical protein